MCLNQFLYYLWVHHISITKLKQNTFSEYCGKIVMKMWWQEKIFSHISITILWKSDATSIQYKWWSNWKFDQKISWQFYEKVMEMWWVEISNCFLAFFIWIFPPIKTQCQMPDAGISMPVWVRPLSKKAHSVQCFRQTGFSDLCSYSFWPSK